MPRETVFTPYPHDPTTGPAPFQMQVGWNRDMDVQVGICTPDPGSGQLHLVDYVYADKQATIGAAVRKSFELSDGYSDAQIGRVVLDAVTGSTPFGTSVWWNPGRIQINQLIRLLRKARDAAYGRDE